jgi:glutaredoxin 3
MFTIYSRFMCPWCIEAKDLLNSLNLPYEEFLVGRDVTRNELLEMFPEAKTVPIILKDGSMIGGFDELKSYLIPKENVNASESRTANSSAFSD